MSECPIGHRCECCGVEAPDLVVVEHVVWDVGSATGHAFCLTECPRCAASTVPPPIRPGTRLRLVAAHRDHLNGHRP